MEFIYNYAPFIAIVVIFVYGTIGLIIRTVIFRELFGGNVKNYIDSKVMEKKYKINKAKQFDR